MAIAGGDRVFKIAENDSPFPRDRVFFGFNHYQNALQDVAFNQRNFDRYTFGFEKTFFNKQCSVELRIPFGSGLNSVQTIGPDASLTGTEFGNLPLVFKGILHQWDTLLISAGVGISLPTARDAQLFYQGQEQLLIRNQAVHVSPILGAWWTPNDRWFVQGFAQVNFDTNGNDVYMNNGEGMDYTGTFQDQSLLFVDLAIGRWLYRNPSARGLTAVVPTVELHYTSTLQNADVVRGFGPNDTFTTVSSTYNRADVLDLTAGLHFLFGERSALTVAAVAPLRTGDNRMFDAECLVQFNRWF